MRKLWLTFTAMLLCSIASFAQSISIGSEADFMKIGKDPAYPANGSYTLTKDLDLGTYHADNNNFVITSFSGTFNGGNNTITYQASFTSNADNDKIGLFETVSGTITNLNLDANITVSGNNSQVNIGLLCGQLANGGTIELCDVTGNVNSTAKSGGVGNASTGLIIGSNLGTLQYCTGHGNVTGIGFVGGLVGSMGTVLGNITQATTGTIKGCYFTGNVTAVNSSSLEGYQSFGGGICGYMTPGATIELCIAEAIIVTGENAKGITSVGTSTSVLAGYKPKIHDTYCSGTINDSIIDKNNECVNDIRIIWDLVDNENTYNPGTEIDCEGTPAECIVEALEEARCPNPDPDNICDENFYFEVINGKVVLVVGQPIVAPTYICDAPTGLTVTSENGVFTAEWSVNNQDNTVNETTFRCSLTNNGETITSGTTNAMTLSGTLEPKTTPYILTIESDCSASQNGLYSDAISYTFYVDANCSSVTGLQVTNITPTTANVSWVGDAHTIKLNGSAITFNGQTLALPELTPATEYTIEAIVNCTRHEGETEVPYQLSTIVTFTTEATDYVTAQSGNFYTPTTWVGGQVPSGNAGTTITIRDEHRVRLDGTLVLNGTIINKGVLVIPQSSGQLINMTADNVTGIVEIETGNKNNGEWTFIGAPFENNYKLGTIYPMSADIAVSKYEYGNVNNWRDSWETVDTEMGTGEGYFAWPFYGGAIIFTTYGDVWADEVEGNYYDFAKTPETKLYNGDTTITKQFGNTTNGRWMALANPYPAKLSVSEFANDPDNNIQGGGIYRLTCSTEIVTENVNGEEVEKEVQTYDFVELVGDIAMTEGFFVNLPSGSSSVTFRKNQLTDNPDNQAKSQVAPREFVELSLVKGNYKSKLYFAHNQEAEQNYDIFDANKLFALGEVAEPYFVTDGIALVKEEVAELPYYATMNVRSFADDTVSFVVNNIPEGLAVSIIDGENIIDMIEGGVYTTEILTGENADRFKVLIKKNVGIADVEELEVNITNNNRHISIATTETDLQVEVYNALGQKVLSTKDRNFTLNQVSAGAYLIKAFNNKASKTQKIVVE